MAAPTAPALSRLLTQLMGRTVTFTPAAASPDGKVLQVYGIYLVFPDERVIVVKADLPLLGSFAGALVGLPDSEVKVHLRVTPVEELLRDAIYEVLNILAGGIANQGRASFSRMATKLAELDDAAASAFNKPENKSYFNVSVNGYEGGKFAIFTGPVSAKNTEALKAS